MVIMIICDHINYGTAFIFFSVLLQLANLLGARYVLPPLEVIEAALSI